FFFFSSRRRHTRCLSDWSSDVCSSDLKCGAAVPRNFKFCGSCGHPMAQVAQGQSAVSALPNPAALAATALAAPVTPPRGSLVLRSEERRVEKECRSGWGVAQ